jgi:pyruvate ferredoxin oxidoreductase alpha subunit
MRIKSYKNMTKNIQTLDGNASVAVALHQMNPDVFGFYPITPTSYIGQAFSKYVADGTVDTEYVCAESEHGAMSICVGAAAAGARAVTATASQGLLLMTEVLWNASGMRLPLVLINGNRSLSAPLSIHCDHNDAMSVRDAGWIQLFAKDAQEAYDFTVCGFPISEDAKVRTPVMVCMDCFHTTHTSMQVEVEGDKDIQKFIGEIPERKNLLDIENPASFGNFDKPEWYTEHRYAQMNGIHAGLAQTKYVLNQFTKIFQRGSDLLVEEINMEDAEVVFVAMGSVVGTLEDTVKILRAKGVKAGIVRPRIYRPLPGAVLKKSLQKAKKILVLDRMSPGGGSFGALAQDIYSLFINEPISPEIKNGIFGLGSRETTAETFASVMEDFKNLPSDRASWINIPTR